MFGWTNAFSGPRLTTSHGMKAPNCAGVNKLTSNIALGCGPTGFRTGLLNNFCVSVVANSLKVLVTLTAALMARRGRSTVLHISVPHLRDGDASNRWPTTALAKAACQEQKHPLAPKQGLSHRMVGGKSCLRHRKGSAIRRKVYKDIPINAKLRKFHSYTAVEDFEVSISTLG